MPSRRIAMYGAELTTQKDTNKSFKLLSGSASECTSLDLLFDNLPELITPDQIAERGIASVKTTYDWKYRPRKYNTPNGLFAPKRKASSPNKIYRDVLKEWLISWEK